MMPEVDQAAREAFGQVLSRRLLVGADTSNTRVRQGRDHQTLLGLEADQEGASALTARKRDGPHIVLTDSVMAFELANR